MLRVDRRFLYSFDWGLLLLLLLVCGMSLFNLYSASYPPKPWGIPPYERQAWFYLAGGIGILALISFDYKELHSWNYPLFVLTGLSLVAVLLIGDSAGGSQRWINLGFFRLQPSEPAKLVLVVTLASYFARHEAPGGYTLRELLPPMGLTLLPFGLILLQPDLGTALMFVIIFGSMTLFARPRFLTYLMLGGLAGGAGAGGWFFLLKEYQKRRIETLLNPGQDPSGAGYQIEQSKIAIGSGGKLGKGYLEGTQGHLHFLPERHTDFAFAVWAEEWGFFGTVFFIGTYFLLLFWGLHVAMTARDRFGVFLAFGVVILIFWQAVINLLMILGYLPVVGIPLPLVSYGGSSLLTTLLGIGIIMNVRMRRIQGQRVLDQV